MKMVRNFAIVLAALALPALAADYSIDSAHSAAQFSVRHLMVSNVRGEFSKLTGKVVYDDARPTATTVEASVDVSTVSTREPQRDTHLKSPDFFDVAQYPSFTFKSTSVKAGGGKTLEVTGELTLHGVTKPITVTMRYGGVVADPRAGIRSGYETEFTIKRSDFGMDKMILMVGDEVKMMVALEGVKQD